MYLKRNVSFAFCPLCLIMSETELGAKYPATPQANVLVSFFKFIRKFRARINIQRVAVEKLADVEVDLCLRLSLPIINFNQYWNIWTHSSNMSQCQISWQILKLFSQCYMGLFVAIFLPPKQKLRVLECCKTTPWKGTRRVEITDVASYTVVILVMHTVCMSVCVVR
jgi:hypothetical protein